MKTLARWVARLYPAAWRARYAVELEALLEDVGPGAGDLWDIARGALFMQMTSVSFWKIVAGCAVAGTLAAGICCGHAAGPVCFDGRDTHRLGAAGRRTDCSSCACNRPSSAGPR